MKFTEWTKMTFIGRDIFKSFSIQIPKSPQFTNACISNHAWDAECRPTVVMYMHAIIFPRWTQKAPSIQVLFHIGLRVKPITPKELLHQLKCR